MTRWRYCGCRSPNFRARIDRELEENEEAKLGVGEQLSQDADDPVVAAAQELGDVMSILKFNIDFPANGWANVTLIASGVEIQFTASYTPRDSISDLVRAVSAGIHGDPEFVVSWHCEPAIVDFRFANGNGLTRLQIHKFLDRLQKQNRQSDKLVTVFEGKTQAFYRAIWRGLRRLQTAQTKEQYEAGWRYSYPAESMNRLTEHFAKP